MAVKTGTIPVFFGRPGLSWSATFDSEVTFTKSKPSPFTPEGQKLVREYFAEKMGIDSTLPGPEMARRLELKMGGGEK